ncbi:hypothetical protein [Aliidiomarina iranensis]|uniref:hypothetical protein n=1 Tax=Aliidiomarina iranensis TaxID=1434071 RepID=UPI0013004A6D|nr:hypothetical protein [Aliidiomarina iranensis]
MANLSHTVATPNSNIANYEASGNLESPKPAGCVLVGELSNKQMQVAQQFGH